MADIVAEIGAKHGFTLDHAETLEEIDGEAFVFMHDKSKAKLLYLKNEDNNKGFSITFKTPAADDTGVFHILEHSVLCGSRKFPVKEPFINLLKSSMQTFLNAMTFSDKTMYPVSSTNDRDLMNLADVYLDAVFHPAIYNNERIFQQEGWHYELESCEAGDAAPEDDGQPDSDCKEERRLVYNGVVYNEMKGAMSDPDSVLYDALAKALFPDTTYRYESGGMPDSIPSLTNDEFLDTHSRHYRPDNSYIVLYGNLDIDEFLGFLDGEYLSPLSEQQAEKRDGAPNPLDLQQPVSNFGVKVEMATAPENSCAALGFVAGLVTDRERMMAISILIDAIMGSNEAPLKRALLDEGLADDYDACLSSTLYQPFVLVMAKGLKDDAVERLQKVVHDQAVALSSGGLDMEIVEAALSHTEFVLREGNFGYPDGVMMSIASLHGWLYDEDPKAALSYIRYEDAFKSLRKKLEGSYFADLIREIFLDNDHVAQVEVVPVEAVAGVSEAERLADICAGMTDVQLDAIGEEALLLKEAQMAPDSPEDLAKLPKLTRADIGPAPVIPKVNLEKRGVVDVLRHTVDTRGIVYVSRLFDMSCLTFDELPYASLLAMMLGKMDTSNHTAAEIDTLVQSKLGSLAFAPRVFDSPISPDDFKLRFIVSASSLDCNVGYTSSLVDEILTQSNFHDKVRMLDIMVQKKVALEQAFANSGNSFAILRASSYYLPSAQISEACAGVDFYVFLKGLIADFDEQSENIAAKLDEIAKKLFTDDGCLISFAGSEASLDRFFSEGAQLGISEDAPKSLLKVPEPENKNEAFVVPTDITFSALVADRRACCPDDSEFSGIWQMASRVLSFDYLWNEVRVLGGAYGVGFSAARSGICQFYSYRDPHIDETIDRFKGACEWLGSFDPTDDELDGYVVSTVAGMDKPLKPRDVVRLQVAMHLTGDTVEERIRRRMQVMQCTKEDIASKGESIARLFDHPYVCVIGDENIISAAQSDMNVVDLLAL